VSRRLKKVTDERTEERKSAQRERNFFFFSFLYQPAQKKSSKSSRRRRRRRKRRGGEREKDAAREQGSGPPEERVGKDTGTKIKIDVVGERDDARARVFSLALLSFERCFFVFLAGSSRREERKTRVRARSPGFENR
jgi:hypothetical protein